MNMFKGIMMAAVASAAMSAMATMQYGYEWGYSKDNGAYITKTASDAGDLTFQVVDYSTFHGESMRECMNYNVTEEQTITKTTGKGKDKKTVTVTEEVTKDSGLVDELANDVDTVTLSGMEVGDKVYFKCVGYYNSTYSYDAATDTYTVGHNWYGEVHEMTIAFAPNGQPLPGVFAVLALVGGVSTLKRIRRAK